MSETRPPDKKLDQANGRRPADIVGKLVALASVLILAGTFIFSVYQYRSQQKDLLRRQQLDQLIRIQSQIRNDTDAISQFPKNKNMTISGAEFLLVDIDGLLRSESEVDASKSELAKQDRRRLSEVLYDVVNEDCDFNEHRSVSFSIAVFEYWDDYKQYVKDDDLIWDLLAVKYNEAIEALRKRNQFISTLEYDKASFTPPRRLTTAEDSDFRHFEDLVRGFDKHLSLLDSGSEQREELIMQFQAASCNRQLTQARFGWSVDPKMYREEKYRDWFKECH